MTKVTFDVEVVDADHVIDGILLGLDLSHSALPDCHLAKLDQLPKVECFLLGLQSLLDCVLAGFVLDITEYTSLTVELDESRV